MSTLANLYIAIDPKAVEAVRVAVIKAVEGTEKVYGMWTKVAEAVKAAWPTEGLMDKPLVTEWIISALPKVERDILCLEADKVTDKKARKAAQDKVSQYVKRTVERAYPPAVIVQPAPELTPEQAEANEAQKVATQAAINKGNASNAAAQAVTNSKIAKSEADTAALKAKAAEAKAKMDPALAEAAALAQAEAEAKAEQAKVEAEKAEAAKAEAEQAKAVMVATQAEAKAKAEQAKAVKMVEAILKDLDALITRVQGYKASIKGGEDLEAGLLGLKTDLRIDNNL